MRKGQALIAVMAALGLVITIGLAVVSRSVTEINVSSVEDESAQALSAAETGLEKALAGVIAKGITPTPGTVGTIGQYLVSSSNKPVGKTIIFDEKVYAGEVVSIDLTTAVTVGNDLDICWGEGNPVTNIPAIQMIGYYDTSGVNTRVYDLSARLGSAGTVSPCSWNSAYKYGVSVADLHNGFFPAVSVPKWLRLRLLFNGSNTYPIALKSTSWDFPSQGTTISSVGQAGSTTQKIDVTTFNPDWAPMFDNAVYSGVDISQ